MKLELLVPLILFGEFVEPFFSLNQLLIIDQQLLQ
jgi:hypothetical protein